MCAVGETHDHSKSGYPSVSIRAIFVSPRGSLEPADGFLNALSRSIRQSTP